MSSSHPPELWSGHVVVLGGTGSLGSHVVDLLVARGVPTAVVSRSAPDPQLRIDLRSCPAAELSHLLDGARAVVNCTDAVNRTDGPDGGSSGLASINITLVERLIETVAGRPHGPSLIHVGSILEYGVADGRPWRESDVCSPPSDYGSSKLAGSRVVLDARRARSCDAVVVRAGNLVGPRPATTTFPGHLTRLLARAEQDLARAHVAVNHDERDFIDVRDVAEAIGLLLDGEPHTWPEVINLSSGSTVPVEQMVRQMVGITRLPPGQVDLQVRDIASTGGRVTWADPALARERLGWTPTRGLRESLADMWLSRAHVLH